MFHPDIFEDVNGFEFDDIQIKIIKEFINGENFSNNGEYKTIHDKRIYFIRAIHDSPSCCKNFSKIFKMLICYPDFKQFFGYIDITQNTQFNIHTEKMIGNLVKLFFENREKYYKIFDILYNCIGCKEYFTKEVYKHMKNIIITENDFDKLENILNPYNKRIQIIFDEIIDYIYLIQLATKKPGYIKTLYDNYYSYHNKSKQIQKNNIESSTISTFSKDSDGNYIDKLDMLM